MATRVNLPVEIVKSALDQAANLRERHIKAATNTIIKHALNEELSAINKAAMELESIPDNPPATPAQRR